MKESRLLFWQIAFTYIGALAGAGFASGQELLRFFVYYGSWGIAGAVLAGFLLAIFGLFIVMEAVSLQIDSYEQYLLFLFGGKKAKIFDGIICLFLWCGLAVMLVAGGSLFRQIWGWQLGTGFVFNAFFLYMILLIGVKGMLWLNSCLIPFLLLLSIGVAWGGVITGGEIVSAQPLTEGLSIDNWWWSAILYVSYNLVLSMVVLVTLGKTARKGGSGGAFAGGLVYGLLAVFLSLALSKNMSLLQDQDIPLLALAKSLNPWLGKGYSLVLWAAIFTTALGNGLGLLKRLQGIWPGPKQLLAALIFLPTLFLLGWPLGKAVGILYPFLGFMGLLLFGGILLRLLLGNKKIITGG